MLAGVGDLSAHFSRSEFSDHRTGHYLAPPPKLLEVLEAIRAVSNQPLAVISGHRCESTNRAVGGAPGSFHIPGQAADIPSHRCTVKQAKAAGASGIGVRSGWVVHVDVRPGPTVVFED